jgi:hypothetical protein
MPTYLWSFIMYWNVAVFFSNQDLYDFLWTQGSSEVYVSLYVIMVPLDQNMAQILSILISAYLFLSSLVIDS